MISKLVVINLPSNGRAPVPQWKGRDDLFRAESCARQLLVGTTDDLALIPDEVKARAEEAKRGLNGKKPSKATTIDIGKEAYEFLLYVANGLQANKRGEVNIAGQIRSAWNTFTETHAEKTKELLKVMQALFEDCKKIRRHILQDVKAVCTPHTAARTLAGIRGGEKVLIIAGKQGATTTTAQVLGRKCGELHIVHPDPSELNERYSELQYEQRSRKTIEADLVKSDMQTAASGGFDSFNHVFVTYPIGISDEVDDFIISKWQERDAGGHLVYLNGSPKLQGATPDSWLHAGLRNFVTPEQILERYRYEQHINNAILEHASRACTMCSEARARGETPIASELVSLGSDLKWRSDPK